MIAILTYGLEGGGHIRTHFASPERTCETLLNHEIGIVNGSPVVSGLLNSVGGLLAVLDSNRQIVSLNSAFLEKLGIDDPGEVMGLRPGEALNCVHAHDEQAGCGTSEYCSSCGAAIAIVAAIGENQPAERICALTAKRNGKEIELAFLVRSHPIEVNEERFILLFLQDITEQQHRAALERTFFHDISNMVQLLLGSSELLAAEHPSDLAQGVLRAANRLRGEIAIQRLLLGAPYGGYNPVWRKLSVSEIINELRVLFLNHPASTGRQITFPRLDGEVTLFTDISLLMRIISNMLINALEAGSETDEVRFSVEEDEDTVSFSVWNPAVIPHETRKRIFQRNFSTKDEPGRGTGTYSMKLLGETLLGGSMDFTSSPDGTEFTFRCRKLPKGIMLDRF